MKMNNQREGVYNMSNFMAKSMDPNQIRQQKSDNYQPGGSLVNTTSAETGGPGTAANRKTQ